MNDEPDDAGEVAEEARAELALLTALLDEWMTEADAAAYDGL